MIKVIGVRFKEAGKIYCFHPNGFEIESQDRVIVETARGVEFGRAVSSNREVDEEDVVLPLKKVERMATEEDKQHKEENLQLAETALHACRDKIIQHKLDMNLVDRSEEHTSELQSRFDLVCRLLLEKKKKKQ